MRIANARVAISAREAVRRDVEIRGSRAYFSDSSSCGRKLDLSGHLLLPGLINAHDHLEFNLFPRLGRRIYKNATEWALDVHRVDEQPVREHLRVAKPVRLFWGGLKNLLSGVTTVAHHNPYEQDVFDNDFPLRVVRRFGWAHSLAFSPDAGDAFRKTARNQPFLIHAGEGTDESARQEIEKLDRMGVLDERTVLVHGVGFDDCGLELIRKRCASMIWCASSNLLTYGRTLRLDRLGRGIRVALGTDSAISAAGDMIDEIRTARDCGVSADVLFDMVTTTAREILRLDDDAGAIRDDGAADLVAVREKGSSPAEALMEMTPEMVIVAGRVHLISKTLAERCDKNIAEGFHPIGIEGRGEWLTPFPVPCLLESARGAVGQEIRLAGKRVFA